MFASQLLRILQTLPPDVNYETCAFDTAWVDATMKENQDGALSDDLNSCENDATEIASTINNKGGVYKTLELQSSMVGEDSTDSNEKEVRGYVPQCTIASSKMESFDWDRNSCTEKDGDQNELRETVGPDSIPPRKMELFERERDFFADKDVKLVFCCKDNTCHVVKDICIDEGVPSKDKILIESSNSKGLCTTLPSDGNQTDGIIGEEIELLSTSGSKSSSENDYHEVEAYGCGNKEKVEIESVVSYELKARSEYDFDDDIVDNNRGSNIPSQTGEANHNATGKIADNVSREKSITNSTPSSGKLSKQQSLKSLSESPGCDSNEVEQQSPQIPLSNPGCKRPDAVSAAEESNNSNLVNKLSYNSKVEGATITFDFNSSKPEASSNGDDSHEKALKIDSEPRHKNGDVSDSMAVLSELHRGQGESSFSMHRGQGESSFSMAGPVSGGLITYSGSIPNSGSISHRSDSSTTSTRSFAFPVLPSEWNSSPVRMAKADRRHYQRRRGWRHGLLCCRF